MKRQCLIVFCLLMLSLQVFSQESSGINIGDTSPALNLTIIQPDSVRAQSWDDLKGKVVILDFWATWCGPCLKAFPHMNKLVKTFKDQEVVFLSVTYEPEEMALPFLKRHPLRTVIAADTSFSMFRSFDAWAIPLVIIVDQQGKIASRLHPENLSADIIKTVLAGKIPEVEQTPFNLFEAEGAEEYFRSLLKKNNG